MPKSNGAVRDAAISVVADCDPADGLAADIEEVLRADRPPGVRRLGVGREDQEFIVPFHANPGDHDRQVARAVRLAPKLLGGQPKRIDVRQLRSRDAVSPEHRMGNDRADLRPFAHRDLGRGRRERAAGIRNKAAHVDVELVLSPDDAELTKSAIASRSGARPSASLRNVRARHAASK